MKPEVACVKVSCMLCEGIFGRFSVWFEPKNCSTCVLCDCVKGGSHKVESRRLRSGRGVRREASGVKGAELWLNGC